MKTFFKKCFRGRMYNDLSPTLIQKRKQTVFLTNEYNDSYGESKIVIETLLRKFLKKVGEKCSF
ncbi:MULTISPECIES: maltose acetyltransferase domain-containing protein [unclassified Dysgonomonas]|uniref:maltose acetyltransferase domain-containing protein n=1 Tax=Dysgonomonas sp. PF1-16 TaxID=2940631 RepID=UPI0024749D6D|nr:MULTISPECIES: maltose acetyltransferase domain-containing protein [unclassified Dysgonomonas]